jgi:hypothetical protein
LTVHQRRPMREALTCGFVVPVSSSGEETVISGGFVASASRSGDESCVVCSSCLFRRHSVELGDWVEDCREVYLVGYEVLLLCRLGLFCYLSYSLRARVVV